MNNRDQLPVHKFVGLTRIEWILISFTCACTLLGLATGDRIEHNSGLGFDGGRYARFARDFYQAVVVDHVTPYHAQRVAPSLVIHITLRALGVRPTNEDLVIAFTFLNTMNIFIGTVLWFLISREMGLGCKGKLVGFFGLFWSYAILKHASYYPILTDVSAMVIALAMFYCFLTNRLAPLCVITVVGAFTWPTLLFTGALLLVFRREPCSPERGRIPYRLNWVLSFCVAAVCLGLIFLLCLWKRHWTLPVRPQKSLILLSVIAVLAYLWLGLGRLWRFRPLFQLAHIWRQIRISHIVCIVFLVAGIRMWQATFSLPSVHISLRGASTIFVSSIAAPAKFIVSHVMYFGPVLLLGMFWWPRVCEEIQRYGLGMVLVTSVSIILAIGSESRVTLATFVPMIVPFIASVADKQPWRPAHVWALGGLSVLFSRVWLPLFGGPSSGIPDEGMNQIYFMSVGPWMTFQSYLIMLASVLLCGGVIYMFFVRASRHVTSRAADGPGLPEELTGQ